MPPALDALVLACLAKNPDDRPQSAAALSRSLAAIEHEPWDEEQAREWWQVNLPVSRGATAVRRLDLTERVAADTSGPEGGGGVAPGGDTTTG